MQELDYSDFGNTEAENEQKKTIKEIVEKEFSKFNPFCEENIQDLSAETSSMLNKWHKSLKIDLSLINYGSSEENKHLSNILNSYREKLLKISEASTDQIITNNIVFQFNELYNFITGALEEITEQPEFIFFDENDENLGIENFINPHALNKVKEEEPEEELIILDKNDKNLEKQNLIESIKIKLEWYSKFATTSLINAAGEHTFIFKKIIKDFQAVLDTTLNTAWDGIHQKFDTKVIQQEISNYFEDNKNKFSATDDEAQNCLENLKKGIEDTVLTPIFENQLHLVKEEVAKKSLFDSVTTLFNASKKTLTDLFPSSFQNN